MQKLILLIFLLPFTLKAQVVDDGGDFWKRKVDSALVLIEQVDPIMREALRQTTARISMWNGPYSTNEGSCGKKGTIYIAAKDFKLNSVNNIAAVLVHENLHIYFLMQGYQISENKEECLCYQLELEFLRKIPNVEPWLLEHAKSEIAKRCK